MQLADLRAALPSLIQTGWGLTPRAIAGTDAGMNSDMVAVELSDGRYVAKAVSADHADALDRGSALALRLAGHGVRSGPARRTRAGGLSRPLPGGGRLALLAYVPGTPLLGSPSDQRPMADLLALVHTLGADTVTGAAAVPFADILPRPDEVPLSPAWVRPAVAAAAAEYAALPALTTGWLHTDPAPEAFRRDSDGVVGLIDWTGARPGPVLYDVASAVMYLGGRSASGPFLQRYAAVGPAPRAELDDHLDTLRRFRAAVQAAYFARRVAAADHTGIAGPAENATGLDHARRMLRELGVTAAG